MPIKYFTGPKSEMEAMAGQHMAARILRHPNGCFGKATGNSVKRVYQAELGKLRGADLSALTTFNLDEWDFMGEDELLSRPSAEVRQQRSEELVEELQGILLATSPKIVVTHNPLDTHPFHISVYYHVVWAIQSLPAEKRPKVSTVERFVFDSSLSPRP